VKHDNEWSAGEWIDNGIEMIISIAFNSAHYYPCISPTFVEYFPPDYFLLIY